MVTEVSTILIITQVSSGLKQIQFSDFVANVSTSHAKIASLATVKYLGPIS